MCGCSWALSHAFGLGLFIVYYQLNPCGTMWEKKPNMECCLGCLKRNTRDDNMNCCCNTSVFISERHRITLVFKSNQRIIFSPQMLKQGTTFVIFIACFARRMRLPKNVSAIPPSAKKLYGAHKFLSKSSTWSRLLFGKWYRSLAYALVCVTC